MASRCARIGSGGEAVFLFFNHAQNAPQPPLSIHTVLIHAIFLSVPVANLDFTLSMSPLQVERSIHRASRIYFGTMPAVDILYAEINGTFLKVWNRGVISVWRVLR